MSSSNGVDSSLISAPTIRLMNSSQSYKYKLQPNPNVNLSKFVLPGDTITDDGGFMRGHGTFVDTTHLKACVAGIIEPVNRLISVRPLRTRYNGEIGDVVVGRIIDIQNNRWKVDTNSRLDSFLMLAAVNLPGGEQRRKTVEDEVIMRQYFTEGDLVYAEVQNIQDGRLLLHTRNMKYGKLGQGVLIKVSPSLVERRKTHSHNLPCGAHVILGNNGFIWITRPVAEGSEGSGGFALDMTMVTLEEKKVWAMIRNVILALAHHKLVLHDTSIMFAYEVATQLGYQAKELLLPEVMFEIAQATKQKLDDVENEMN